MNSPDELREKAEALVQWLESQNLNPVESLAICGLFASAQLATMDDSTYKSFLQTLDAAYQQAKMLHNSYRFPGGTVAQA